MLGLASSEGLGRTAVSGSDFQAADAATAAPYLRRTYALSCASPWIRGARPRSRSAQCAMRRMTTSSASLSFSRLGLRTLPPANANGRERCPSRRAILESHRLRLNPCCEPAMPRVRRRQTNRTAGRPVACFTLRLRPPERGLDVLSSRSAQMAREGSCCAA